MPIWFRYSFCFVNIEAIKNTMASMISFNPNGKPQKSNFAGRRKNLKGVGIKGLRNRCRQFTAVITEITPPRKDCNYRRKLSYPRDWFSNKRKSLLLLFHSTVLSWFYISYHSTFVAESNRGRWERYVGRGEFFFFFFCFFSSALRVQNENILFNER